MAQTQQIHDLYKALNNLHGLINDQEARIDNFLNQRCDDNKTDIDQNSDAVLEVTEDTDTRITELEDAVIELANTLAE